MFSRKILGDCAFKRTMGYSCAVLSTGPLTFGCPLQASIEFVNAVPGTQSFGREENNYMLSSLGLREVKL